MTRVFLLWPFIAALCLVALPSGAGTAATRSPIVIGMVAPLTGPVSVVGSGQRAGADAAVDELNRTGGIRGRRVELRLFDDASNPTQGYIRMQELTADGKVLGVLGSGTPATALASAPLATRVGIPFLSLSPNHSLFHPPRPYVYTPAHTTRQIALKLLAHLRATGVKRVALLRGQNPVGIEGVAEVRRLAKRYGLRIVSEQVFPSSPPPTTFVAQLLRVKSSAAQALWLWDAATAITVTKEFRQLRLRQRLLLLPNASTTVYLRPACVQSSGAANGVRLVASWAVVADRLPSSNASKRHALRIERIVGKDASTFAYHGYTAVMMLAKAIRGGAVTRAAINRALERMTFVGPDGTHRFSRAKHVGPPLKSLLAMRIRNCKPVPLAGQDLRGR